MQLKRNYVQFTSEEPCSYKWKLHADCPEYASMDGSKSIKTSTIAIVLWNNSNFALNMTTYAMMDDCVAYDVR